MLCLGNRPHLTTQAQHAWVGLGTRKWACEPAHTPGCPHTSNEWWQEGAWHVLTHLEVCMARAGVWCARMLGKRFVFFVPAQPHRVGPTPPQGRNPRPGQARSKTWQPYKCCTQTSTFLEMPSRATMTCPYVTCNPPLGATLGRKSFCHFRGGGTFDSLSASNGGGPARDPGCFV